LLRKRREVQPKLYDGLLDAMGDVAEAGVEALAAGDLGQLGVLFDLNHGYLNACGVSSPENEQMVYLAREAGALGAKITGAGCGGAVVALAPDGADEIIQSLRRGGFDAFETTIGA
jgi:mevalonate kinase